MCDWGGNGKLFFPLIPHPSSCSLPPSLSHTQTQSHFPPPGHHHHHHYHWYPTESYDAAHLVCQPSHFRCHGKHLSRWLLCASPYSAGYPAGSLSPSWHRPSAHIGSADGIRGSRAKKGWRWERGGPFFLFSSNGGSFQESHSFQCYSEACNTSRKTEKRGVKYEKCFTHLKVSL